MTTYIISAAPSQGKSYIATKKAVQLLKDKKVIFSNYPIIYTEPLLLIEHAINIYRWIRKRPKIKPRQLSSLKWDDTYVDAGLHDCTVILDEAYKIVNCHDKLTDAQHDFFATTGHNNVDVFVIAQNYARINLTIREMAMFMIIRKFSNPLSLISRDKRKELTPLFFTIELYLSEKDYQLKGIKKDALYKSEKVLFDKTVAKSYDTQYYRRKAKDIIVISWLEDMMMNNNNTVDVSKINEKRREEEWIQEMTSY